MSPLPNANNKPSHSRRKSGAQASRRPAAAASNTSRWPAFFAGIAVGLAASWLAPKLLEADLTAATTVTNGQLGSADEPSTARFNFPELFRDNEVVVPEGPAIDAEPGENRAAVDYYIQTGSFRASDDAEALRVKLLLLNLDASVEPIKTSDGLWHRVVVGPFGDARSAEQARSKLHQNAIRTLLLKRPR